MKKLSQENIEFISTYLQKSGVDYFDIRMEMTDHVASEIENRMKKGDRHSFYLIFKEYMQQHKTHLLKNYKGFKRMVFKRVMIQTGHNLFHSKVLAFVLLILVGVNIFPVFFSGYWSVIHMSFTGILFLFYLLPYFISDKDKHSRSHFLLVGLVVFNYFTFKTLPFEKTTEDPVLWGVVILCWINAAILKSFFDVKKHYKRHFQKI